MEFLLRAYSARVARLERALDKNWIGHVILAGIGVALALHVAGLQDLLAVRYLGQPKYSPEPVAAIALAFFLYNFMQTGNLLTAFNQAKEQHVALLKEYLSDNGEQRLLPPLTRTTNFLGEAFSADKNLNYMLVASAVISTAQASALFLFWRTYGYHWLSISFPLIFIVILHVLFWSTQNKIHRATAAMLLFIVFTIAAFLALYNFAP